jgi:hypothetical protein
MSLVVRGEMGAWVRRHSEKIWEESERNDQGRIVSVDFTVSVSKRIALVVWLPCLKKNSTRVGHTTSKPLTHA